VVTVIPSINISEDLLRARGLAHFAEIDGFPYSLEREVDQVVGRERQTVGGTLDGTALHMLYGIMHLTNTSFSTASKRLWT
jgi:hypothetical protein